jgi:hypothetical protein
MTNNYTCVQWLNEYQKEVKKIKEHSPFLMVLSIAACIEFLGKLLRNESLDNGNECGKKFEEALSHFDSLKKYSDKNFYHLIRCGLAHRASVKEGIILSDEKDSKLDENPIVLNTNDFYRDFVKAIEEAQSKNDWPNPSATKNYVSVFDNSETGATNTILYTFVNEQ